MLMFKGLYLCVCEESLFSVENSSVGFHLTCELHEGVYLPHLLTCTCLSPDQSVKLVTHFGCAVTRYHEGCLEASIFPSLPIS